jgi:hypothetical protein
MESALQAASRYRRCRLQRTPDGFSKHMGTAELMAWQLLVHELLEIGTRREL